jgi:hypothetical protein
MHVSWFSNYRTRILLFLHLQSYIIYFSQAHELNGFTTPEGSDFWKALESLLYDRLPTIFVRPEEFYIITLSCKMLINSLCSLKKRSILKNMNKVTINYILVIVKIILGPSPSVCWAIICSGKPHTSRPVKDYAPEI